MHDIATHVIPMPAIETVTVPHKGLNFLRPEILLDFISVTDKPVIAVTPLAVLYSTVGVLQTTALRKIPVLVSGRVVYPITSQSLPCLHSRLTINTTTQKLRFQGDLDALSDDHSLRDAVLIGVALEFTVEQGG
ncbi:MULTISPECIES: dTDP-glucose pyrophosphorylase [Enterobacteriaceae]|uniref:dTDP-glucose pyrophosphorylase n=1 Tax=Kluyvera genomosp. 2 TaxID=2774054 RepID=A0A2T2XWF9_9ENTR|nr:MULTISPECIES: dTDP-glucose pyrophosphorylase [Enterobacteriaceae]HAT3919564.1 dTDP-glucose pyrophosphorylase [Kluyvera ascorbata]PSR44548.1 dTDP-glucose pyrophosphorylase [Kluyvera genomosp. 2]BBQ83973.1 dTDP-glucose pyrophosphorylase [Klebsiella sp. WP3-W18-ESBL-02]BBR20926.1 dTDP-glucose pyrophosphorylase [Klebsiella sp. WP3-S18-ESBL-05]BBR58844.1 dTDP-glucose pyrophosphorylase [Klebsiella sp. WP4-W18-ESBL-05]